MSRLPYPLALVGLITLLACGGPPGGGADGGSPSDAGPTDAGPTDAGPTDAGPTDAGPPDAGPTDTTPPETTIDAAPSRPLAPGDEAAVAFSADEPSTFECRLDAAAWATCTSAWRATVEALGAHVFEVRATDLAGNVDPTPASATFAVADPVSTPYTLRIVASNVTSGRYQAYEAPGIRILQALGPDIALMNEFNYENNTEADLQAFVTETFGPEFYWSRELEAQIPNGVVSRFPILESGEWNDDQVTNRDFAWARIDIPGPVDLWAVSVHLLTDSGRRPAEATALVSYVQSHVPEGDYLVIGGDFNTKSRTETCVDRLGQVVEVEAPWPVDQSGNGDTSAARDDPYDWVAPDADLAALEVPLDLGPDSFPNGVVFDTREFTPLSSVPPALEGDSGATAMQHMAVARDFRIP